MIEAMIKAAAQRMALEVDEVVIATVTEDLDLPLIIGQLKSSIALDILSDRLRGNI